MVRWRFETLGDGTCSPCTEPGNPVGLGTPSPPDSTCLQQQRPVSVNRLQLEVEMELHVTSVPGGGWGNALLYLFIASSKTLIS